MGVLTEDRILTQLKKGQGETNQRLDRIAALLEQLVGAPTPLEPLVQAEPNGRRHGHRAR